MSREAHRERIALDVVAVAMAALFVVALTGCTATAPKPKPPSPEPFHVSVDPARSMTLTDAAYIDSTFLQTGGTGSDPGGPTLTHRPAMLLDDQMVRKVFPAAMFPRDTLGRPLLAIMYSQEENRGPRQEVVLIYEGPLVVHMQDHVNPIGPHEPLPKLETTQVGAATAELRTFGFALGDLKAVKSAGVSWTSGKFDYGVWGRGLTTEQVLRVARSMAP